MHASTRRLAIRAAAKVALSVSLANCGGVVTSYAASDAAELPRDGSEPSFDVSAPGDARAEVRATADAAVTVDARVAMDVGGDAAVACGAMAIGTDAGVSERGFACCVAEVRMALADASFVAVERVLHDAETQACCGAIVRRIDQDHASMSPDLAADYAAIGGTLGVCCDNLSPFPMGPACAP